MIQKTFGNESMDKTQMKNDKSGSHGHNTHLY